MPSRYDSEDLRRVYRRLYRFTDYGIISPPVILQAHTRQSPTDIDYQPSRVQTTFTATAIDPDTTGNRYKLIVKCKESQFGFKNFTPTREENLYLPFVQKVIAFFAAQTGSTVKQIRCDGEYNTRRLQEFCDQNGIILKTTPRDETRSNPVAERDHRTSGKGHSYEDRCSLTTFLLAGNGDGRMGDSLLGMGTTVGVKERNANGDKQKVEEHRNVRFDHSIRGYTARITPQPWNTDTNVTEGEIHVPPTFSTNESKQISREERQISPQTDTNENDEMNDESSIVVVEHNTAPARNVARPLPPPPPLEQVARAEDTPVVQRNRNRTPTRSSARPIQFVDSKHLPHPKPKASRDIDGDVSARNIVDGKRGRRQTPEGTATHSYKLAIAEDDETQFAPQTVTAYGTKMSVCLQGYSESRKNSYE
eukprot:g62278.t1